MEKTEQRKRMALAPLQLDPPRVMIAAISAGIFLPLARSSAIFNDGDTSWHIAAGNMILSARSVPRTDPFSFTFTGSPWTAHEWLSEVIMAAALNIGAWSGLALMFAAAAAAFMVILGLYLQRWLTPVPLAAALIASAMALAPFMLARPHVLAWPLLAWWTILLVQAREKDEAPPMAAALPMLLWANLHGSFIFGLLLGGFFALEALTAPGERQRRLLGWAKFGLAALACALATPHGIQGLLFPLHVSAMESLPLIMEWRPTILGESPGFQILLLGTLFLLLLRGARVPALRLILLIAMLYLAFSHVRHQAVLVIVGLVLLAEPLGRALDTHRSIREHRPLSAPLYGLGAFILLAGAALLAVHQPLQREDSPSNPLSAIASVPDQLRERPVLNGYAFGGPLILAGIAPFIDGRADMYGDDFLFEHERMMRGNHAAFAAAVASWNIGWTMLEPNAPLVRLLDADPAWSRTYADPYAVIHVRR